jgi:peroxiredoxin Q/BCP
VNLRNGDPAPDFTLTDQDGSPVTLSTLWKRGPVVLFFYPKDGTVGCTAEACAFRDAYDDFQKAGATVVGISSQGTASKKEFATKNRLPFTLVSDEGGEIRKKYGVKASFLGLLDGRETFVIDGHGIVRHVFNSQINATKHVPEALGVLATLKPAA